MLRAEGIHGVNQAGLAAHAAEAAGSGAAVLGSTARLQVNGFAERPITTHPRRPHMIASFRWKPGGGALACASVGDDFS